MRVFFFFGLLVVSLGFAGWAYNENYKTRAALEQLAELQELIGLRSETLVRLEAEWAHLNRPERIDELVNAHFEALGLVPLTYERYRHIREIPASGTVEDPRDLLAFGERVGAE